MYGSVWVWNYYIKYTVGVSMKENTKHYFFHDLAAVLPLPIIVYIYMHISHKRGYIRCTLYFKYITC